MIIGVRIDFRLLHGQVANLWANSLNVGRFMVVDDDVAQDSLQKQVLKMACPTSVRLSVLPVEKAAANILAGKYDEQRLFIIAKGSKTVLRLIDAGVPIEHVNVGNMASEGTIKNVTRSIAVTPSEIEDFKAIASRGVTLTAQMVPSNAAEDFMPLLEKA
ncbi:Protein-N(pi)-phosphohistidine--sugarphosphotran sferase [Coriobacterium glomerans PW2]|uniref:Protein-N(Pi)-phosphohistidine--sugarphosphotran sferase n=1 Tax=Coriobacterium glomerans (strain ATCC 49209 / DSM 20642 / JCM 10262 / PW2) TaxID=700015 RepID=F2NAV8_CORGP|nr:PTS sugar transporter subunit IIB [Coriobacterium glomerans]AEB07636.1 Protein-N(pi)-phosphohistidine--sugarphosphotran sferase [Coriobacterium glomerans PW2]